MAEPFCGGPLKRLLQCAEETTAKIQQAPATRHLRLAGVELLRAMRCTLDALIETLEPPKESKAKHPPVEQQGVENS